MKIIVDTKYKDSLDKLSRLYTTRFFNQRKKLVWRANILCPILVQIFPDAFNPKPNALQEPSWVEYIVKTPINFADVGCGGGEYLSFFAQKGFSVLGVESSTNALNTFKVACPDNPQLTIPLTTLIITDITQPMVFNPFIHENSCGLAVCLEVGEHIEPEYSNNLVKNLTYLSDTILFSAARPGQGGLNHINCHPVSFWHGLFSDNGFLVDLEKTAKFKTALNPYSRKKELSAYYNNGIVFKKCI